MLFSLEGHLFLTTFCGLYFNHQVNIYFTNYNSCWASEGSFYVLLQLLCPLTCCGNSSLCTSVFFLCLHPHVVMLSGPIILKSLFCDDSPWMMWDFRSNTLWESWLQTSVSSSNWGLVKEFTFNKNKLYFKLIIFLNNFLKVGNC